MKRQLLTGVVLGLLASPAMAILTPVTSQDLPHCDMLAPLPNIMDELGTLAFPLKELITSSFTITQVDACPQGSDPVIPNALLIITNKTGLSFKDLHYVADPETTFSNYDGIINGEHAVKIDNVGLNRPLIAEIGGSQPLVFEPGETWEIVLDDWQNLLGMNPADLASSGVPSAGFSLFNSSGSIVANPVPEPASAMLIGLGAAMLGSRHRNR